MKNWVMLLSILFLASCSSSRPKEGAKPESATSDAVSAEVETTAQTDKKDDEEAQQAEAPAAKPAPPLKPLSADNYSQLSKAIQSKNETSVLDIVGKNLGQNPNDTKTWNALGAYYLSTQRPQMARIAFRRGLDYDKGSAAIYNNIGLSYIQENDLPRAVDSFRQALNADPNNAFASANLGSLALQFGNFPRAKELLEKAYAQNQKNDSIAFNYARASAEVSDFDTSVKVLDSMVSSKNRNPLVYFVYGSTLALQKKDLAKAKQILNKVKVLTTDPGIIKATDDILNKLANPENQGSAT